MSESAPGECSFEEKQKSFCWIFSLIHPIYEKSDSGESSGPTNPS